MFLRYSDLAQPSAPRERHLKRCYRRNLPHIQVPSRQHFITFRTWKNLILPEHVRSAVLDHCLFEHGQKLHMYVCVVMPDHVHAIFTPLESASREEYPLRDILGSIKGASAHTVNLMMKRRGHVWQDESFDHVLRHEESLIEKIEYVRQNPVRRRLAGAPDEYPWLWIDEHEAQPRAAVPQQNGE